jgi:UDP-N-acetylglucosamine/UDP-N-acetylgalactosamine diphosphorylase
MREAPADLREKLKRYNQLHVLYGWDDLSAVQRAGLIRQLLEVPWEKVLALGTSGISPVQTINWRELQPASWTLPSTTASERAVGQAALEQGQVAALVVAGGQGTRLGTDQPKGTVSIGPLSGASLFQIHAEKILSLSRRYRRPLLWLIMTSPATDAATREFFDTHGYFGLNRDQVRFFVQGTMPVVCARTRRLLLEAPGQLLLSPNGHGGTLTALAEHGLLEELESRGVEHIFYFQVDNPLVRVCDPGFLGRHILSQAEVSSKVVLKEHPQEKVGIFACHQDRCVLIEYSDLPAEMAQLRDDNGRLRYAAGNPAIHIFRRDFLQRVLSLGELPFHVAHKVASYFDPETGQKVTAEAPNAWKFEQFIFDVLPHARSWLLMETSRAEEFAPLKNADGPDSLQTVPQAIVALHRHWLLQAGVEVQDWPVEISPLFARDVEELLQRLPPGFRVTGPTYLREEVIR